MPSTPFPTAEEQQENRRAAEETRQRVATAVDNVVDLLDQLEMVAGWRGVALRRFFQRWEEHRAPDDPYWYAAGEFLAAHSADQREGSGFDDGLRNATIKLMLAADHATTDAAETDEPLFLRLSTFRDMETAHEQIGKELDRIRRER